MCLLSLTAFKKKKITLLADKQRLFPVCLPRAANKDSPQYLDGLFARRRLFKARVLLKLDHCYKNKIC